MPMDPRTIRDIMSGLDASWSSSMLRGLLLPLGGAYGAVMQMRRAMYCLGWLPSRSVGVPVISVGNLTAGGTGKTPMVAWLACRLREWGKRPAVLIRGYKASGGLSDEAELLSRLTGGSVIVDSDRVAGAEKAVSQGADVLVMDDGFQHLRLKRDLDIVLIDATEPLGFEHCLPRGLLREPVSILRFADMIVVTRSDVLDEHARHRLGHALRQAAPEASLHWAVHRPTQLLAADDTPLGLEALAGKKVAAFCGIGNPDAFFRTLESLGAKLVLREAFGDHETYAPPTRALLKEKLRSAGGELTVTTEKDQVKLADADLGGPLYRLAVTMEITEGLQKLESAVRSTVNLLENNPDKD